MKYFFYAETIPLTVNLVKHLLRQLNHFTNTMIYDDVELWLKIVNKTNWNIYPLLQAYGFIMIKDGKNPL